MKIIVSDFDFQLGNNYCVLLGRDRAVYTESKCSIICGILLNWLGKTMDGQKYIHSDTNILVGKPVVRGTRLSVEFLLGLFAAGWTEKQVLENYPTLTPEELQAVYALAAECIRDESLYTITLNK